MSVVKRLWPIKRRGSFRAEVRERRSTLRVGVYGAIGSPTGAAAAVILTRASLSTMSEVQLAVGSFLGAVALIATSLAGWAAFSRRHRDEFTYIVIEALRNEMWGHLRDWERWTVQMHTSLQREGIEQANQVVGLVNQEATALMWYVPTSDQIVATQLGPDAARHYAESPDLTREAPGWIRGDAFENTWRQASGRIDWLTRWLRDWAES